MELTVFDLIILSLIGLSALIGLLRGVIKEVISLTAWTLAFWLSVFHNNEIANLLTFIETPAVRNIVSGSSIFLIIILFGVILNFFIGRMLRLVNLGVADRIFGGLFGVIRGLLIVFIGVFLGHFTPVIETENWENSKLIPLVSAGIDLIKSSLSKEMQDNLEKHVK